MAYVSKTWVDRDSQYPTRRIIVHPDLTEEQVTVRRDEGIITTQGDVFDANTMNNLEARIAAGLREKQDELTAGTGIDITNNVISATGGGGASALDDLTDVDINSPTNGQALVYDAGNDVWVNGSAGGGGSSTLAGLTDVALATPADGQALCYDAATQKWKNSDAGGAGAMVEKTATGAVASFSDGADNLPLKSVVCAVSALQSGSGDPAPNNERQIIGFTGLNIYQSPSRNLFSGIGVENYFLDANGDERTSSGNAWNISNYISVIPNKEYYFTSGGTAGGAAKHCFYDEQQNFISSIASGSQAITIPYNAKYMRFSTRADASNIQLEIGSSATAYQPYSAPTIYPVTWQTEAGTVYACLVNPVTGVLTVTWAKYKLSDLSWGYASGASSTSGKIFSSTTISGIVDVSARNIMCSIYKGTKVNYTSQVVNYCINVFSNGQITVRDDDYDNDVESWKTQYGDIEFIVQLATPQTFQLSPQEIKSLLGANNIWHDANGDTTVTYRTETAGQILDVVQENTGVEDLSDVSVSNVSNGQVLKYNSTSQKWENANESGGGAEIDDTTTAQNKVWSSSKTSTELSGKQGTLTAGTGISIDSNNVISATGGGGGAVIDDTTTSTTSVWSSSKTSSEIATKQNALTAGFGINIDSNSGTISYDLIDDDVSDTLYAGVTSMTLSSQTIQSDSLIDIYVENGGAYPTDTVVNGTNVILTFEAQATDINVRMIVHHSHRP